MYLESKGYSLRAIAAALGRSVSTISDELKRNSYGMSERTPKDKVGSYDPTVAHHKAYVRRRAARFQAMRIVQNTKLCSFVEAALLNGQSPDAIAGRLATGLDALPRISADTIYRYIASPHGRRIEYERALVRRRTRAKKRQALDTALRDRTFITERPAAIALREEVGDIEADFIVSGKSGTGYLLTVIDRKSRYGFIRQILPVTIAHVEAAFENIRTHFPELTSLTLDNDILFRFHERLARLLGVPIYFTEPYASWQKGSIENYNKHVRKYIPKGADISRYTPQDLAAIESRLNQRYMRVLGYRTPAECLAAHRRNQPRDKNKKETPR